MPRLQKPESTRVHANADASTMSLRWVATCDECAGAPDTRPAHPNTANSFFLQRLWKIPCPVFSIQPAHSRLAITGFASVLTLANCLGVSVRTTPQKNRSQRRGTSLHNLLPAKDCYHPRVIAKTAWFYRKTGCVAQSAEPAVLAKHTNNPQIPFSS